MGREGAVAVREDRLGGVQRLTTTRPGTRQIGFFTEADILQRIMNCLKLKAREGNGQAAIIKERAAECKLSLWGYYRFIEKNEIEQNILSQKLCVNETYFFRNEGHFDFLEQKIIELAKSGRKRLVLVSAACATGEETYSMALLVDELFEKGILQKDVTVTIAGIDINEEFIEKAKNGGPYREDFSVRSEGGKHNERMARAFAKGLLEKDGDEICATEKLRSKVWFMKSSDLIRDDIPRANIMFMRKALLYMNPEAREQVIVKAFEAMPIGGSLVVGADEIKILKDCLRKNFPDRFEIIEGVGAVRMMPSMIGAAYN